MKNRNNNVGGRINLFDEGNQTVYDFNKLFPECPIPTTYSMDDQARVGEFLANNCREIFIGSDRLVHKMYSDLMYGLDKELFFYDETERELTEINGTEV